MMKPGNIKLYPDIEEFSKHWKAGKSQIVWSWIPSDLETPVSVYLKLCAHAPYSFLLESVEGGENLGRYSIIGTNPDLLWSCYKKKVQIRKTDPDEKGGAPAHGKPEWMAQELPDIPALQSLKENISQATVDIIPDAAGNDLPPMCAFGLFGYIGYDMIRLIEDIPEENPDELKVPDSVLMRPTVLAIFDNIKHRICLVTAVREHSKNSDLSAEEIYGRAQKRLQDMVRRLNAPLSSDLLEHKSRLKTPLAMQSNFKPDEYKDVVKKAVEYIYAGEIFQVVPSQRFSVDFDLPSFELYRSLRSINPSPFLFHLSFDDFSLVGSSPEILVRVRDRTVTIRPIAGTRKRGKDAGEDRELADDLLSDPKELAEHLMLLDLGRNDVGRVSKIGSVNVTQKFIIEYYSHVMHIVSNVEGELRDDCDVIDALFAGFPAGTVSGAPKIRAMEIIDELEKCRRSTYAGGIGYFSENALDSCIALRTALVKDGKVYVQAGGGVVADSDPEMEHQECRNKARAVIRATEETIRRFTEEQ